MIKLQYPSLTLAPASFDNWPGFFASINYFCNVGKRQIMTVSDLKLKIFREIDSGKGIPHEEVMENIRRKYSNA